MPNIRHEKIATKLLPIIYVLDTSGSMIGDRISAVNEAMKDTAEVLKKVSANNADAQIMIGVLTFSSEAKWITPHGLIYLEDFYWEDLRAGGMTYYGLALEQLNLKLSRNEFLNSKIGFKLPVIIFMSDGGPNDKEWKQELENINQENRWFREATKIALAVGDEARKDVLAAVTGSSEAVFPVTDLESLEKLIRVVSVTASKVGSMSRTENNQLSKIVEITRDSLKSTDNYWIEDDWD